MKQDIEFWTVWIDKLLQEPFQRLMQVEDLPRYGEEGFKPALYSFMMHGFATVDIFKGIQLRPEAVCLLMEYILGKSFCNFRDQAKHILDGLHTKGVDTSVASFFNERFKDGRLVGLAESLGKYNENCF